VTERQFQQWRPHPWHGVEVGPRPPAVVTAYIEITPFDVIKYEVDKPTGLLKVDRPQMFSSSPPTLYGFIPRTYCAERVAALSPPAERGDGDPLDICVFSERPIDRSDIILTARIIGGLRMIDEGEADDKIVAVLEPDLVLAEVNEIDQLPASMVDRLQHYFATYKLVPGVESDVRVEERYGRAHALRVVEAAIADYDAHYGPPG
jgi:inorganic pyrophosphatase